MSAPRDRPPSDPSPPAQPASELDDPAQGRPADRRSSTRPKFVEGWRKALKRKPEEIQPPSSPATEPTDRIDLWVANPVELLRHESSLQVLSEADWTAINRIQDPTSRRSSIAARILLRIGLSRAADHKVGPSFWRFETAANGRPVVAAGLLPINFSTSHVDQLVVLAVSSTLEIGIDVECVDQNLNKKIIADFCHMDEQLSVGGLPRSQEIREFLRFWTLKEAYTKMIGLGHTLDFKMLKFTLDPVRLDAAGGRVADSTSTHFDNFFVSYKHALFLASLAIRHPAGSSVSTEVQIISLAKSEEGNAAHVLPLSD